MPVVVFTDLMWVPLALRFVFFVCCWFNELCFVIMVWILFWVFLEFCFDCWFISCLECLLLVILLFCCLLVFMMMIDMLH